jgi:uncharacterized protein with HEPN domain
MEPPDRVRLRHMLDAAQESLLAASGRTRDDLDTDRGLLHTLVRSIEVVGEAAGRLSYECRETYADLPWSLMVAMRNRMIHAYFDIDSDIVWRTVTVEFPRLVPRLREMLGE